MLFLLVMSLLWNSCQGLIFISSFSINQSCTPPYVIFLLEQLSWLDLKDHSKLQFMLLLLWHCLQRLLIDPWDEIFLWSNHWMFSNIAPSYYWVEFSRSSSYMLVILSDISLGVFKDDTCKIQWRRKYSYLFWLVFLLLCFDFISVWICSSFFDIVLHASSSMVSTRITPCL